MTNDEWDALSILLSKNFKWPRDDPYDEVKAASYFMDLGGYEIGQVRGALRALVAGGQVWGPVPGEIVPLLRTDAAVPTFVEMLDLVYGRRGIIRARPDQQWFDSPSAKAHAEKQARIERCKDVHPLVGKFAVDYGLDRLYHLPINDPEWGDAKRKDLRLAWEAHCAAMAGRELAEIAAGVDRSGGGLHPFDPLAVLDGHAPKPAPVGELEAGG